MRKIFMLSMAAFFAAVFFQEGHCADREVVDSLGRKVQIPENPSRVVTFAPSLAEVVFALGQGHRLKGVSRFSNYPPEVRELPKVGSYVHLDLEKIVALKPDLCIAIKDGNPLAVIRRLEGLGVPVYAVSPRNLGEVADMILDLGSVLDASEQARAVVADMNRRIEKVKSVVSKAPNRPKVFFQIGMAPIVSVGDNTFIDELIGLAGGVNLTAGETTYPRLTREEVIALAPDVFIVTSMAREKTYEAMKTEWQRWKNIPAVRDDRIFLVDSDLVDRPTPRLVQGLEMLARLIHPRLFEEAQ